MHHRRRDRRAAAERCRGDFTFPAGRQHTNPRIKVPYLCSPYAQPEGYDRPEAAPEIACGNAVAARDKFFIWNSPTGSGHSSLDYMSASVRRHLEDAERTTNELLDTAYVADRRLYIKTHAHSLHPFYFEHSRTAVFPHQYPATQTLLSVLFDAATRAGLAVEFLTAPEVYDGLLTAKEKPVVDLVGTYLQEERPKSALKAISEQLSIWHCASRRLSPSPAAARETLDQRLQVGSAPALTRRDTSS